MSPSPRCSRRSWSKVLPTFAKGIRRRLARLQPSGTFILSGIAILVGLLTGGGVWLFKQMITWGHVLFFGWLGSALAPLGKWTVLLLPAIGGLLVGLLWHRLVGEERYHGVAGIMEAVALVGGRLEYRLGPVKAVAAALSIGAGASVGPEAPAVQIGANLGSFAGQRLRFSDDWIRTLVAAGGAAGIAAAFNAPIAGVFFALEIILGEITGGALGVIVLASVTSAVFTQAASGPEPAFRVPAYAFRSFEELPLYLVLGVLAGLVAVLYITALDLAESSFRRWHVPGWLKTTTAGLMVGIVGLWLPQVFGMGYDIIDNIFNAPSMALALLVALLAAKLAMTAVSIGGGFPGGVLAPSLFLGATLGAAYGTVIKEMFPLLMIAPQAYAMVGMAAVLAASIHAPLTAIILLFEMTQDYHIILPLMATVIIALLLGQWVRKDSIYSMTLSRKGLRLQRGRDIEVLEGIAVGDVMEADTMRLHDTDSIAAAAEVFNRTRHHGLPVVDSSGQLVGILTVRDVERAQAGCVNATCTVGDVCMRDLLVTYPDESIGAALQRMSRRDIGRLPVVDRNNPRRLLGLLRRSDLVRAYDVALTRHAALRHRHQADRLELSSGAAVSIHELTVMPGAPCLGRPIRQVGWPDDSVIASLRRRGHTLVPHGDTILQAGDVLLIVAEGDGIEKARRLCSSARKNGPP